MNDEGRDVLSALQAHATESFVKDGGIAPMAIVLARRDPETGLLFKNSITLTVTLSTPKELADGVFFKRVRRIAACADADVAMFCCLAQKDPPDAASSKRGIYVVYQEQDRCEVWWADVEIDQGGGRHVNAFALDVSRSGHRPRLGLVPPSAWLN